MENFAQIQGQSKKEGERSADARNVRGITAKTVKMVTGNRSINEPKITRRMVDIAKNYMGKSKDCPGLLISCG